MNRLQLNLCSIDYFGGFSPILNWWKTAAPPSITRSVGGPLSGKAVWDAGGLLDANGDVVANSGVTSIARNFWSPVNSFAIALGADFSGEQWVAEWTGSATGQFTGGVSGSSPRTFTMPSNPNNTSFTLTVTNQNDPPRNIKIYQARYATNVANGETFNPDWLVEIRKFGVIRFMGWQLINNSDIVDFSQMADKAYHSWGSLFGDGTQTTTPTDYGPKGGMHPELICELANLIGREIHICVPLRCTDALVTAFATYVRDHTTVKVNYEYSNECWHTGFNHYAYCITQGTATFPSDGLDIYTRGWKWYGYRSSQVMAIVRGVYNDSTRWIGALNFQAVNLTTLSSMILGFNAWKTEVGSALFVRDLFHFHCAPYFGYMNAYTNAGHSITDITKANPAVVTSAAHGYSNGQRIKIFIRAGMVELDNTYATITLPTAKAPTSILTGATTTVTLAGHGYPNNRYVKWSVVSGMTQLNGQTTQITVLDANTFTINVNSSGYSAWVSNASNTCQDADTFSIGINSTSYTTFVYGSVSQNICCRPEFFDLCDKSNTLFVGDPVTHPTKYTYFNQQAKKLALTGVCDEPMATSPNIAEYKTNYWPTLKTLATTHQVEMRQYEGGYHLVSDPFISAFGGVPQFTEYLIASGYSQEIADCYAEMFRASIAFGFKYPSKFQDAGVPSRFGTWGGIRFWALAANGNVADTGNAVWSTTLAVNGGAVTDAYAVHW